MPKPTEKQALDRIQNALQPLTDAPSDYDPLLQRIGEAALVLIGEASHGTQEFYQHRAEITKRLIQEKGFHAVAVEADWPDAHRVNQYVRGRSKDQDATQALGGFSRFPAWMWRNEVVAEFVHWLRQHNGRPGTGHQVGFYGLDLYSLHRSRAEVVRYLERVDPAAARRARERYACFDHFGEDEQAYGYAAGFGTSESCEREVVQQLIDLQRRTYEYRHRDGQVAEDDFFSAEQNARLVRNAEEYYRATFRGRVNTWNLRDRHMAETLHALLAHLDHRFGRSKVVVWAHNSHLGDARATERGRRGEWNLGQLVRERYPRDSFLVGFTTYTGTVTAAHHWDEDPRTIPVRPARPDSYEALFHEMGPSAFLVAFDPNARVTSELRAERWERAIGVVYRPETERFSHYFHARLPDQFDAVLHIDRTQALRPLERHTEAHPEEVPDTFPSGV
jgi:erythromycin esterase-like protein